MNFEQLHPTQIPGEVEKRLIELRLVLNDLRKMIEQFPSGHLKLSQRNGRPEFYHITDQGSSLGTYIPASKKELAAQLAQKNYNTKVIKIIKCEIEALENFLRQTDKGCAIQKLYINLCKARQMLIKPVTISDEHYAAYWKQVPNQGESKPFAEDAPRYYTANGERVRSKSEVIIADALLRNGVPYRYEYPVKLKRENIGGGFGSVTFFPDFLCLNVRTRGEFYWEHFGKMDDLDYSNNVVGKINLYAANDYLPGRNLIFTMESGEDSLDTRVVEKMIKEFLL